MSKVVHKFIALLLEPAVLHVSFRNCRDNNLFYVDLKFRNFPSARGASAANGTSRNIGTFN